MTIVQKTFILHLYRKVCFIFWRYSGIVNYTNQIEVRISERSVHVSIAVVHCPLSKVWKSICW